MSIEKEIKDKHIQFVASILLFIMLTLLCNSDPLNHSFYVGKLEFTGICFIFLHLLSIVDGGYPLEPPQSMFGAEIRNTITTPPPPTKIVTLYSQKNRSILHRRDKKS